MVKLRMRGTPLASLRQQHFLSIGRVGRFDGVRNFAVVLGHDKTEYTIEIAQGMEAQLLHRVVGARTVYPWTPRLGRTRELDERVATSDELM